MSDHVNFKATLDITAQSENSVTSFAIEHLRGRGYGVTPPNEKWETVGQFMKRVGLRRSESFHASLDLWQKRGHTIPIVATVTNRILELLSNADFDAFVLRNKR